MVDLKSFIRCLMFLNTLEKRISNAIFIRHDLVTLRWRKFVCLSVVWDYLCRV
jgi:hypothetical protein